LNLITSYPLWFILFCLLLGVAYASILYFRQNKVQDLSKTATVVLAALRFLVVALISFLLLSPMLKTIQREVEKPVIVIAQDKSQSITLNKDSSFYNNEYLNNLKKLENKLSEKYVVKTFSFGDKVSEGLEGGFQEKFSDYSTFFDEIYNRFSNRNIGAILFASDGIFNRGSNPIYNIKKLNVPIFTIALGDTAVRKDLILKNVAHNQLAYLSNSFPLEIIIEANKLNNKSSKVTVSKNGNILFSQLLMVQGNFYQTTIPVMLKAEETGMQRYTISLASIEGEITTLNNTIDVFIDVLDSRQKVLILANSPHPDVAAIKNALKSNINLEVESDLAVNFNKAIDSYNLIILHQLPSADFPLNNFINTINEKKIPVLSILGSQNDFAALKKLPLGYDLIGYNGKVSEAKEFLNKNFSLFSLSENTPNNGSVNFPPLTTPFGEVKKSNSLNNYFYQKIGTVETDIPLIAFNESDGHKTGIVAGEGLWRWRISNFQQQKSFEIFDNLINKIVQYLAAKEDKSFFRINSKNKFSENEPIEMNAELYNESYDLIQDAEVTIVIKNEAGNNFPFTFSNTGSGYKLNAGKFPSGQYTYNAKAAYKGINYNDKGKFSVSEIKIESSNLTADHQLLNTLATTNKGKMYLPTELDLLAESLLSDKNIVSVSYANEKFSDLVSLKWIFFLLLSLLSIEWFIRKRSGGY
jgi:hypothetical protein